MLKKLNDFLAGVPATIVAGLFLLLDPVPHLVEEFGGTAVNLNFLPFDPAWVTVIISGIPMLYLAVWRVIHNPGISKISSALLFLDDILLHVSRPVRWDSDHVVIFDDELKAIAQEIVRGNFDKRVHIGLDFFDASINRIAAWVIGTRNMQKALMYALLEPTAKLKQLELEGDYTSRLALLEEYKSYPFAAVWDYYCEKQGVPVRDAWLADVKKYEADVLSKR